MQLTPLQLEIQQRADKTLSFGCIVQVANCAWRKEEWDMYWWHHLMRVGNEKREETSFLEWIITTKEVIESYWHPMNWGRLYSFLYSHNCALEFVTLEQEFKKYNAYQQTVLERPVELQELVLAFLNTLWPL